MAQHRNGEVVLAFDYKALDITVAEQVRASADHIRKHVKQTLENIIQVGQTLKEVKEALPHGKFGTWLRAEFGWRERMARNFMSVAEHFGPKAELIADLQIQPTAAYLLAAPSAPEEARQIAVERAEAGEPITGKIAKDILTKALKRRRRKNKPLPAETFLPRLHKTLERYKERWSAKDLAELARQLREFADKLEQNQKDKRTTR